MYITPLTVSQAWEALEGLRSLIYVMLFRNGIILHLHMKNFKPYAAGMSCHTHDSYSNKKVRILNAVSCYFPVLNVKPSGGNFWGPHHDALLALKNGRVLPWRRTLPFLGIKAAGIAKEAPPWYPLYVRQSHVGPLRTRP